MSASQPIYLARSWYPLAATPAVCLTQDSHTELPVNILTLDAPDVGNILFTAHADPSWDRRLDFTCCHHEVSNVARNILILTMILDDEDGIWANTIWNIYYHLHLSVKEISFLRDHAKWLLYLSKTKSRWATSKYGSVIQVGTEATIIHVRQLWRLYTGADLARWSEPWNRDNERVAKAASDLLAEEVDLDCMRPAFPIASDEAFKVLPDLQAYYWRRKCFEFDPQVLDRTFFPNPMFTTMLDSPARLKPIMNPLKTFHLASALGSVHSLSVQEESADGPEPMERIVNTARLEFKSWLYAFWKRRETIIVRFVLSDAIAFCHTLQLNGDSERRGMSANWYASPVTAEALSLDSRQYSSQGPAPNIFDVIDTTNLVLRVEPQDVLLAARPLLSQSRSAVIYTECARIGEATAKESIAELFGEIPFTTMTILLDLALWDIQAQGMLQPPEEEQFSEMLRLVPQKKPWSRARGLLRLTWHAFSSSSQLAQQIRIEGCEATVVDVLSGVMHDISESCHLLGFLKSSSDNVSEKVEVMAGFPSSNLGGFALFLLYLRRRGLFDWEAFISEFRKNVEESPFESEWSQEMYCFMHLFGLDVSRPSYCTSKEPQNYAPEQSGLRAWDTMPPVVRVTVVFPRTKLDEFKGRNQFGLELSSIFFCATVQCLLPGKQSTHIFRSVDTCFGEVSTSGIRHTDSYALQLIADGCGWYGSADLVASFWAPRWLLLEGAEKTLVSIGVERICSSAKHLAPIIGTRIHTTGLSNAEGVYITRNALNMHGQQTACGTALPTRLDCAHIFAPDVNVPGMSSTIAGTNESEASDSERAERRRQGPERLNLIKVLFEPDSLTVHGFSAVVKLRAGHEAEHLKSILGDEARTVMWTGRRQPDRVAVSVSAGSRSFKTAFDFPVQVDVPQIQGTGCGIDLEGSANVQVTVPVATQAKAPVPVFIRCDHQDIDLIAMSVPRLCLDVLAEFETTKPGLVQRLNTTVAAHLSNREVENDFTSTDETLSTGDDLPRSRSKLNDSILDLFLHYTASSCDHIKYRVFGLAETGSEQYRALIIIEGMRLDASNRNVVLDAAYIPLLPSTLMDAMQLMTSHWATAFKRVDNDEDAMKGWMLCIAVMAERCRMWPHRRGCEYKMESFPLQALHGMDTLCSCGRGRFPPGYLDNVPGWANVRQWATRIAISPFFAVPWICSQLTKPPPTPDERHPGLLEANLHLLTGGCDKCSKKREDEKPLLTCNGCKSTRYCSKQCQKGDWASHKQYCAALASGDQMTILKRAWELSLSNRGSAELSDIHDTIARLAASSGAGGA